MADKFIAKSEWEDGPWQNEPDEETWIDQSTDLRCAIRRAPVSGCLCGYVGVTQEHPAFGLPMYFRDDDFDPDKRTDWGDVLRERDPVAKDALERMQRRYHAHQVADWRSTRGRMAVQTFVNDIRVHGGITWANYYPELVPDMPAQMYWFFGFDCSHAGDLCPAIKALMKKLKEAGHLRRLPELPEGWLREEYRTIDYVRHECHRLARQIADIAITVMNAGTITIEGL